MKDNTIKLTREEAIEKYTSYISEEQKEMVIENMKGISNKLIEVALKQLDSDNNDYMIVEIIGE